MMTTLTISYDARNKNITTLLDVIMNLDANPVKKDYKTGIDEALDDVKEDRIYTAKDAKSLSVSDKLEIYRVLKKSLLCDRMEHLLNSFDGDELSMEDITETIETVRQERYENGRQYV